MSTGEQIEIHLQRAREAKQLFVRLQGEAGIHAQRLSELANRLSQLTREPAVALAGLNDRNMIFDSDMNALLASCPSRAQLDSVLTGMVTAAGTFAYEQEELRKLGIQLTE